ncbi:alpha/beta fold hydrolase [Modestobacter altitudinis]|uniref:alpha/beta fold hydrolase n=1 Tax=Modestobacter altitudinis TaxID=2213158 RepID=UPI00110CD512|nr:alpha/beta fold hydrolase [Modestobacter altitudinis]
MPVLERPDSARISWESDGPEGAPAVLLVMGLAYPAAMWFRLVPALAEGHRVIRVDNRGAGRTGDVPGAPYTVETMAGDCLAVLDAAGVHTAHVVGISMGGLIAQEIVLTAPERVRSLCLIATHPGIAHAVSNPQAMAVLMQRGQMTPQEAAEASIPFNYAPGTPRERIEEDWAVRLPLATTNEGYLAQAIGSSRWDGYDRMAGITAPTLVLHGELDALVPPENGRIIAGRIPGAELVVVPDANHLLMTDQPEHVSTVLVDWLDRNR